MLQVQPFYAVPMLQQVITEALFCGVIKEDFDLEKVERAFCHLSSLVPTDPKALRLQERDMSEISHFSSIPLFPTASISYSVQQLELVALISLFLKIHSRD